MSVSRDVSHKQGGLDLGCIPNTVRFGIHEAAPNRQGPHFNGAMERTYAWVMTL